MGLSMLEDWKQYLNVQIFKKQLESLTAHQLVQRTHMKGITASLAPLPRLARLQGSSSEHSTDICFAYNQAIHQFLEKYHDA